MNMNLLSIFRSALGRDVAADPQVSLLPAGRVSTEFHRIYEMASTKERSGGVINSRMYAFKQSNGRMAVRLHQADTFIDPMSTPNILPDFMAVWFMSEKDKNLTAAQALARLQAYEDRKLAMGQEKKDFMFPRKETRLDDARRLLACAAP